LEKKERAPGGNSPGGFLLEKAIKRAGLSGKSGFINYRNLSLPKIVDGEWILDDIRC